jgi:hypothetical protein
MILKLSSLLTDSYYTAHRYDKEIAMKVTLVTMVTICLQTTVKPKFIPQSLTHICATHDSL